MKILPVGAELFQEYRRTDGRTDRHDEANAFRSFANAPKNGSDYYMLMFIQCGNVL